MYSGNISGIGPRYCPSIEDKIARFEHKTSHQIFVEPEGKDSDELYPNGISTSLPLAVQEQYVQSITGFENAIITKPGYAVEYDFVLPDQLKNSLETKKKEPVLQALAWNGMNNASPFCCLPQLYHDNKKLSKCSFLRKKPKI